MNEPTYASPQPLTYLIPTVLGRPVEYGACVRCGQEIAREADDTGGVTIQAQPDGTVIRWAMWEHEGGGPACTGAPLAEVEPAGPLAVYTCGQEGCDECPVERRFYVSLVAQGGDTIVNIIDRTDDPSAEPNTIARLRYGPEDRDVARAFAAEVNR